jgi:parallel beta-helix repeat protein
MGRKVIAFWLSTVMLLGMIVIVDVTMDFTVKVRGSTLYVNTTGSGGAYTSIQDAINATIDGDTVFIYSGTYYENVIVNKTINLTGEDMDSTIVDGGGSGTVISLDVDWVNVSNLMITNGEHGLRFSSDNCMGMNINSSFNTRIGIRFSSSNENALYNSISYFNGLIGIYVWGSDGNRLINNTAKSNSGEGIAVADSCDDNILINNTVVSNTAAGIWVRSSAKNTIILNNTVSENKWHGIYLTADYNNITGNTIESNDFFGIQIFESIHNVILNNTITSPKNHGVRIVSSQWTKSKFNILKGNVISTANVYYGIWLDEAGEWFIKRRIS